VKFSSILDQNILASVSVFHALKSQKDSFELMVRLVSKSLRSGGKLLLCGNGGSAADCQHIAAEFVGRFLADRHPLPAISLTVDTSAITSIANDYGYEAIFSRQVEALGRSGDCLLAISTSGNSKNVVNAVRKAKGLGIITLGLTGKDGGLLRRLCHHCIMVPSEVTARVQEAHIFLGHSLCEGVEAFNVAPQECLHESS